MGLRGEIDLSRFVIHGGWPLQGEIRASGSKNAVLPMIAAALLTEEEVVLENVPSIRDVDVMLEIAGQIGAEVSRLDDRVTIKGANLTDAPLPVLALKVPLEVDARAADNWDEAH